MNWFGWVLSWIGGLFRSAPSNSIVTKIQAAAVKFCGFLPTAETVVALVGVHAPAVVPPATMVLAIAKKICVAVTASEAATSAMGGDKPKPMVDGIVIEGEWVNKE